MAKGRSTARTFAVLPALDVLDGRCVRLAQGDVERITVEGGDPAVAAARFAREGATRLHLVDLDGAFGAAPSHDLVARVAGAAPDAGVQVGGGYRQIGDIRAALEAGADRVVIGTAALRDGFLAEAVAACGAAVAVAVDARDGQVAVEGWTRESSLDPAELARRCEAAGVAGLVVTSTRRDGSLTGPDVELLESVLDASGLPLIASGGIASLADIETVRALGCEGVIVGSAIWLGRVALADALALETI